MKKSELKNFIREEIISTLSESIEDETAALEDYEAKLDDVIKKKEEAGIEENLNEAREYDADAMEALGFDLYPGGRNEAFRHATEELGVPVDEILGKISDDVIYNAIHHSLQVMDMYPIEEKVAKSVDDVIDPADYINIGRGYLKGFKRPHSLKDADLETLGRKIVKVLAKGDIDKAKAAFIKEDEDKEPSDAEIKKNKSLAKAAEELAVLTREMKSLAKKYSKAEGQEKEDLLKKLKSKTKLKKELDKILDK